MASGEIKAQINAMESWKAEVNDLLEQVQEIVQRIEQAFADYELKDSIVDVLMKAHNIVAEQAKNLMKVVRTTVEVLDKIITSLKRALENILADLAGVTSRLKS